jgi:monofunctional glycosyltransferase
LRLVRSLLLILVILLGLPYVLVLAYGQGHPVSTVMLWRWLTGDAVSRVWMDLDAVSPALPRAVIAAEDSGFCAHHGVEWDTLQKLGEKAEEGEVTRGGSTLTQQVAKNLFLWQGRSYLRKGLELPLALWIDFVLSKRRIMELYLNIAEWGPTGQFGADAGARYAFGRDAGALTLREAALMAAILPNPVSRSARAPGPGVRRLAGKYAARAQAYGVPECLATGRGG